MSERPPRRGAGSRSETPPAKGAGAKGARAKGAGAKGVEAKGPGAKGEASGGTAGAGSRPAKRVGKHPPRDATRGPSRGEAKREWRGDAGSSITGTTPAPSGAAGGHTARVARVFEAPASAVFAAFNDPTRRAWSPEPLYRVLSALAPRFVRLALPDGTQVAAAITRQGNNRCAVSVEVMGFADKAAATQATTRWRHALGALGEQLDTEWA